MADRPTTYAWLRRLAPYLRPRLGNLVLAFSAMLGAGLVGAGLLLVQRQVLDLAVAGRTARLAVPFALLIGLCVIGYAIQRLGAYRELKASNDVQLLMYDAVHWRMQEIDVDGQSLPAGQLAARLNSDVEALSRAVAMLPRFTSQLVSTLFTSVLMFMLSPVLAAPTLLVVPLLALVSRRARRRIRPATWDAQQCEGDVAQVAAEAIAGVRVVKALGQEAQETRRMRAGSDTLYAARMRLVRLQAWFQPLMTSVSSLAQVMVFALGGWLMLHGELTIGTFVAFSSFAGQLVSTVSWFADTIVGLQEAGVSAGRVLDIIDLPPAVIEAEDAVELPPARGELRAVDVTYAYPGGRPVIDGVSLVVAPGEFVAVAGASGAGKSTLVKVLARFHDPDRGTVAVDGVDIRAATLDSLRRRVAVVFDDPMLFTGTIRDNVAFGRADATDDEVIAAATVAGAHDFVTALPLGYQTAVGERGFTLSGGQRQRIALARALLVEPAILFLDDAIGAVDAAREQEILAGLRSAGRTVVMVAYRASAMAAADRVVVLDRGRIVAEGTHDDLIVGSELYRSLVAPARPQDTVDAALHHAPRRTRAARVPEAPPAPPAVRPASGPGFSPLRLLRPHAGILLAAFGLSLLQAGIGVANPYITRFAVDDGVLVGSARGLAIAVIIVAGMTLFALALSPLTLWLSGASGQRVIRDLRMRIWSHMVRLPIGYFEQQKQGRLLTRVVNDVEAFTDFATGGLIGAVVAGLTALGVLTGMLAVNPLLGLVAAATLIPFVLMLRLLNHKIMVAYLAAREHVAEANAVLQENLAGARESQAFRQQERQQRAYLTLVRRYLRYRLNAEYLMVRTFPLMQFLSALASAVILAVGALLLTHGRLSAGDLVAFMLWTNVFFPPVVGVGQFFSNYKRVQVSAARIVQLMSEVPGPPEPADPVRLPARAGELTLTGVRFAYPSTTREVLRGMDLTVPAGRTLAVIGVTGIGKSTVFKLMARFYDPTAGAVLLDGIDLRRIDPADFRAKLAYLPQEPYLFAGTVRDNIAYARPDADDDAVRAAATTVGAHQAITALDSGYDHPVGDRGAALPAGLRQLLCLARAQLIDPAVVLLDEATAKLDLATEMRVLEAVRVVSGGRTTVLIAHRLQTAMLADYIAVIDEGQVAEWGTHQELLALDGRYAALYRASDAASGVFGPVRGPAVALR